MSYAPNGSDLISTNGDVTRGQRNDFLNPNLRTRTTPNRKRKLPAQLSRNGSTSDYPIIFHCHLCWDWVWQRPQQFMSRLSQRHRVLFVETVGPDPNLSSPLARFSTPETYPNVTVLRLQFPAWRWSNGTFVDKERRRLVKEFLAGPGAGLFDDSVQWFYDPMAVPAFLGRMGETLTVYDCMDELSKFRCAPPEICAREALLLKAADVVFTGGRKLYESKKFSNDNCHFYGCGVEVDHFGKAREPGTPVPDDLAQLPKPILGYFGVVDERMDYELVARLADANPGWSIVIIGPVLKVEARDLPQRANLHWLGGRAYADLPGYCKGFDLCLMPFALNESTEFINPTKALEYMASGRPIVSTPVSDVVTNFSSVVKIGRSPEEFIDLCRQSISQPDTAAVQRGLELAGRNTWDSIVSQLESHIEAALLRKRTTEVTA
jgi:glycosyltransferase involved in cell wall biosynthesis